MLPIARCHFRGFIPLGILLLSAAGLLATGQAKSSASQVQPLGLAAARVLREGRTAKLPPHLSTLLGVTQDAECPVMQGTLRAGKLVQGFDVSLQNKTDIILFVVDEGSNDQTLYLTSARGRLRKMVSVNAGVGRAAKITEPDRAAFEKQKQFWISRLAPGGTPK